MKKSSVISLILVLCMLLSSCSTVYIDPEKGSDKEPSLIEGEYFTDGSLYKKGESNSGFFYEGCWIYIEMQKTIGPNGFLVKNGQEYVKYGEVQMKRIVKYNPHTGTISSPCLDPVCNHSYESGCLMVKPQEHRSTLEVFSIQAIIGDWMLIRTQHSDDEYITLNKVVFYNLKTGESKLFFDEELGGDIMTRWICGSSFEHKYYNIKQVLDYSETEYIQGSAGKDILDYSPKTKNILCEFDLDSGASRELFEIPENYNLFTVSNKRFFFVDDMEVMHSCNYDGSNMSKEEYLDFFPENKVGTYAYYFTDIDGFIMFDLKTNEKRHVSVDYDEYYASQPCEEGILLDHVSEYERYREYLALWEELPSKYAQEFNISLEEGYEKYDSELNEILFGGTSKVYMCDFDGGNMRVIYEEEHAVIRSWYASGDFLFAERSVLNADGKKEVSDCVINMKTGEITNLPLLDIVVPDWYINDPSVFN